MAANSNFGFVYNYVQGSTTAQYIADLQTMKAMGVTRLRLFIPFYQTTFLDTDSTVESYHKRVLRALNMGFYVIWGLSLGYPQTNLTKATKAAYATALQAEATWAAAQGNPNLEVQFGNEDENHNKINPTSLTQTGGVATFVSATPHNFTATNPVTITFAVDGGYNGAHTITVVNSTTFTFTVPVGTAASETRTFITAQDMTDAEVRQFVRDTATASGYPYTKSYSSSIASNTEVDNWASEGILGLTRIGFNKYDYGYNFDAQIKKVATLFAPGKAFISEWNTDEVNSHNSTFATQRLYRQEAIRRKKMIDKYGLENYFYNWRDSANLFGIQKTDGNFHEAIAPLINERAWFKGVPNTLI